MLGQTCSSWGWGAFETVNALIVLLSVVVLLSSSWFLGMEGVAAKLGHFPLEPSTTWLKGLERDSSRLSHWKDENKIPLSFKERHVLCLAPSKWSFCALFFFFLWTPRYCQAVCIVSLLLLHCHTVSRLAVMHWGSVHYIDILRGTLYKDCVSADLWLSLMAHATAQVRCIDMVLWLPNRVEQVGSLLYTFCAWAHRTHAPAF